MSCVSRYKVGACIAVWYILPAAAMLGVSRWLMDLFGTTLWTQGIVGGAVYILFGVPAVVLVNLAALRDVNVAEKYQRLRRIHEVAEGLDGTLRVLDFTSAKGGGEFVDISNLHIKGGTTARALINLPAPARKNVLCASPLRPAGHAGGELGAPAAAS
jgi:hypothetical protein